MLPDIHQMGDRGHFSALAEICPTAKMQRAKPAISAPHPDGCPLMTPAPLSLLSVPSFGSLHCFLFISFLLHAEGHPPPTFSHSSAPPATVKFTNHQALFSCSCFSQTCQAGLGTPLHLPFTPALRRSYQATRRRASLHPWYDELAADQRIKDAD